MTQQLGLVAVSLLLLVGIRSCALGGDQHAVPPAGYSAVDVYALDADGDNEVQFTGLVLENVRGCEVDAACVLRIAVEGGEINVMYHYGEFPPCENTEAVRQGEAIEEGAQVEVYAGIVEGGELSTCDSPEFYVHEVSGG